MDIAIIRLPDAQEFPRFQATVQFTTSLLPGNKTKRHTGKKAKRTWEERKERKKERKWKEQGISEGRRKENTKKNERKRNKDEKNEGRIKKGEKRNKKTWKE